MLHLLRHLRFAVPHLVHGALIMAVLAIHVISPGVTCLDHLDAGVAGSHHRVGALAGLSHSQAAPPPALARVEGVNLPPCSLQAPDSQQPLLLTVNEPFVEPEAALLGAAPGDRQFAVPTAATPAAYAAAVAPPPPRTA